MEFEPPPVADYLGLVGQKLGSFIVRQAAAAGGVAMIYRGEHESLRNAVAIKVLTPELVKESFRPTLEQMFLREAQILSQLRSDDILRALDHGSVACPADGLERPYIVVDWLDGRSLSDELDDRRRRPIRRYSLQEAVEVLEPIARALACCHESGIVHRDVNPRNVFLENAGVGKVPRAKLIDFGFAKEVARTEALRLHQVAGTLFARSPDYAAPEHYDREKYGELSENTDIYTLALMLVEMLTLEPPLRGFTDSDLYAATANRGDRPTPNNRGAHVSNEVEQLFTEALAVDQFERPGSVLDWWQRLKEAASRDEALGTPPAEEEKHRREPPKEPPAPAALIEVEMSSPPPGSDVSGPEKPRKRAGVIAVAAFVFAAAGGAIYWQTRPLSCEPGFADCNGERSDGCEADLTRDSSHCGACGTACSAADAACAKGKCRMARCPSDNLRDCNGDIGDGCETDVSADVKHCGGCGTACNAQGTNKASCAGSKCLLSCQPGYGDCDNAAQSGCEVNLSTDTANCGRCGRSCGDRPCADGLCAPIVLTNGVAASHLAARDGALHFWDSEKRTIERIGKERQRQVLVEDVEGLTGLVVGAHGLVWATAKNDEVFTRSLGSDDAPTRRIAGPLRGDTRLSAAESDHVSWANRAERRPAAKAPKRGKRARSRTPAAQRTVFTAPLERVLDKAEIEAGECEDWPKTFIGDEHAQYCCDEGAPLTRIQCRNGRCTHHPCNAACPEDLVLESEQLYFAQDVRVLSLDTRSEKMRTLAKRKRRPRGLLVDHGYAYWLEGGRQTEVWRVPIDAAKTAEAELLARGENVSSLTADAGAVYWVAEAAGEATSGKKKAKPKRAIYMLPLPLDTR